MTRSTDDPTAPSRFGPAAAPPPSLGTPEVPVPPGLQSMWRLFRLGYQHEPGLLVFAIAVTVVSAVPDALLALWLKLLADGVADGSTTRVLVAMAGMALSVTLTWVLTTVSDRMTRRFRDKVTIALETHVARLQASIGTVAHHERADYLDRLSVLREQIYVLDHMYMSVLQALSWLIRLGVTLVLLATVHPLLLLLALFAVPSVVASAVRPARERDVEERQAVHHRLAEHLFRTATTASAGKEVRVTGIGQDLVRGRRESWDRWYRPVARARAATACWHAVAWAVFGLGFVLAIWFATVALHSSAGQVLMLLAAGSRLSAYIASTVGEIGWIRGTWLYGARRLAWLEDYATAVAGTADRPPPRTLRSGLALREVTFTYPGAAAPALDRVDLVLPAGSVVAVVGENGAGKSTLVKLLAGFYRPDSGRILVDDTPLDRIDAGAWRTRLTGAFQDFSRFEFRAGRSVGVGDLPHAGDRARIEDAVTRAGADDMVATLPRGLDTQLGPTWPGGVEVSFGQWQKLALARGFMRPKPLVLLLDEPTAALDADTEHALFERYSDAARSLAEGGITVLVSHRFSTVAMADLIVVLDGASVVQVGTHDDLMRDTDGQYAQLFTIQQRAYR